MLRSRSVGHLVLLDPGSDVLRACCRSRGSMTTAASGPKAWRALDFRSCRDPLHNKPCWPLLAWLTGLVQVAEGRCCDESSGGGPEQGQWGETWPELEARGLQETGWAGWEEGRPPGEEAQAAGVLSGLSPCECVCVCVEGCGESVLLCVHT